MGITTRWQGLLTYKQAQEAAAAKVMGQALAHYQGHINQLEQLQSYFDDYLQQSADIKGTTQVQLLKSRINFGDKLRFAIEVQTQEVAKAKQTLATKKAQWQRAHQALTSIQRLIDAEAAEQRTQLEKKAQAQMDELVGIAFVNKPPKPSQK